MFLSDISIKRPVMMTVFLLIIVILGAVSYMKLGVELFPEMEFPMIVVSTTYSGAGPEEVERLITKPIEDNVTIVDNVKYIKSTSSEGVSTVMIRFNMGADLDVAANDVRDQISRVEVELPSDVDKPLVMKVDPNAFPIIRMAASGNMPLKDIFEIADNKIRTELSKVAGVGLIRIIGGEEREIEIAVRQNLLDAKGVSIGRVIAAIGSANLEIPGGNISKGKTELTLRVLGEIRHVDEIGEIPIPGTRGTVRVADVATVTDTVAEVRKVARFNSDPSVGIEVLKQGDANTILAGLGVKNAVRKLNSGLLPPGVSVEIVTDDSVYIRDVVKEVRTNMIEGIILTALALFLFLHNWRETFIVALAMPASVIATFILMNFAGYTINMMSMMGLAISVGILVNNSILVLENIHRYIDLGEEPKVAAAKGTGEIAIAVTSTALTNIVVFLPIAFMESIVGQVFKQFAMTVVFATVFSLIVSFTLTPMIAGLLLRSRRQMETGISEKRRRLYKQWDGIYETLSGGYADIVRKIIARPWATVGAAILIFFAIILTIPKLIGGEFFPQVDQGEFVVNVETDVSSSLEYTDKKVLEVEGLCAHIPELDKMYSTTGSASGGGELGVGGAGVNLGQVVLKLVDKKERERSTEDIMDSLRPELAKLVGAKFTVSPFQQGGPGGKPIELEIRGEDFDVLNRIADQVLTMSRGGTLDDVTYQPVEGLVDADTDWRSGKPEISLMPQRDRLRRYNVTVQDITETIRAYYAGVVPSMYREGDDEYDIRVKLADAERRSIDGICNLTIQSASGEIVKVGELVEQVSSSGPSQLYRKDREHMVRVMGGTSGKTSGEVYKEMAWRVDHINLPPGYSFNWAGEIEFMKENFGDLYQAMLMAVVLSYLMLAGLLESWRMSALIMLSLPLAFAGVFVALLVRGLTINIFSLMGMVMLIGLVINNAIVIIDYIGVVRKEGVPLAEAIPRACAVRFRPILMANITTVIAMIPLALGVGAGGEYRAPMAVTQMGGLIAGGLLALIIAPALYFLAERGRSRRLASKKRFQ